MLKAKGVAVEGSAALEGAPADYVAPSPKRLKAGGAGDYPDTDVQYFGRVDILPVCPGFAMSFKRTTQAVQRCKHEQQRCSYGRDRVVIHRYAAADAAATWTQVPYPEDASRTYWWNEATGETRTDAPEAVADANCDVMEASLDAADRAAAAAAASVIPPGWAEAACPTSGRAYFYHAETGQTSWSRPEA